MTGFILPFKVFLGQNLDKFSEKSNLCQKNTCCPPRLMTICTYILGKMFFNKLALALTITEALSLNGWNRAKKND